MAGLGRAMTGERALGANVGSRRQNPIQRERERAPPGTLGSRPAMMGGGRRGRTWHRRGKTLCNVGAGPCVRRRRTTCQRGICGCCIRWNRGSDTGIQTRPVSEYTAQRGAFASIHFAKDSMNVVRNFLVPSFVRFPASSNKAAAPPIYASGCCIAGTFRNTSDCRR